MLKFTKFLFFLFILQLATSCQTTTIQKKIVSQPKVEDKTLVKPFVIKWNLEKNFITKLPKEAKKVAKKYCQDRRIILIKLDTNEKLTAKGTFICGK